MRLFEIELLKKNIIAPKSWKITQLDNTYPINCCVYDKESGLFIATGSTSEFFISNNCEHWVKVTTETEHYPIHRMIRNNEQEDIYAIGTENGNSKIMKFNNIPSFDYELVVNCNGYVLEDIAVNNESQFYNAVGVKTSNGAACIWYKNGDEQSWEVKLNTSYGRIVGVDSSFYNFFLVTGTGKNFGDDNYYGVVQNNLWQLQDLSYDTRYIKNLGNGVLVITCPNGYIVKDASGTVTSTRIGTNNNWQDIIKTNSNKLITVSSSGNIAESEDNGDTWTEGTSTGLDGNIYSIAYGNERLLTVSTNGKISYKRVI